MTARTFQADPEDNLLTRPVSLESYGDSTYASHDDDDAAGLLLANATSQHPGRSFAFAKRITKLCNWRRIKKHTIRRVKRLGRGQGCISIWLRKLLWVLYYLCGFTLATVVVVGIFFPSYTKLPPHYKALQRGVEAGWKTGSANTNNEKIFIAASIFDPGGELARGDWAHNVLSLVDLLGPENVYLSIYENDSGDEALEALSELEIQVPCNHTLVAEPHLSLDGLPHVVLQDGTHRIKRIAYLAEVRNRALRPLEDAEIRFDKLLYLNDVVFKPIEAAQLLFSTNVDENGTAQYRSACAVDFINAFKFYDTFATRDLDGFSMGVPFFPWFPAIGGDSTLDDLLANSDAVRVRSCWGGMVAFDAQFFQNWKGESADVPTAGNQSPAKFTAPFRFRADTDLWWDSSECCLIQADIQSPNASKPEIYLNPYIRVAYDSRTLSWLWLSKRFEKLYTPIHFIADLLVNLPQFNPRRDEIPWQTVNEVIWVDDQSGTGQGKWERVKRIARHDAYCGRRTLQVIREQRIEGERYWEFVEPPPYDYLM